MGACDPFSTLTLFLKLLRAALRADIHRVHELVPAVRTVLRHASITSFLGRFQSFGGLLQCGREDHLVQVLLQGLIDSGLVFLDVVWDTCGGVLDFRIFQICAFVGLCDVVAVNLSSIDYDR